MTDREGGVVVDPVSDTFAKRSEFSEGPWSNGGPMTCRVAVRTFTYPVCEWNPESGRLAVLADPFHGTADVVLGAPTSGSIDDAVRVCVSCAARLVGRSVVGAVDGSLFVSDGGLFVAQEQPPLIWNRETISNYFGIPAACLGGEE